MDFALLERAKERAAAERLSLAAYVRKLISRDLDEDGSAARGDHWSASIIGMARSDGPTDVASRIDDYLAIADTNERRRKGFE